MKTIAISIDEDSLAAIDGMARSGGRQRAGKRTGNRSEVIRRAVREFILRQGRLAREEKDRKILASNRRTLDRQAAALVAEQADL